MVGTMYDPRGTGRATAVGAPYRMAGKTGTAQRVSRKGNVSPNPHLLPLHLRHQAWFIGYAPAQDPEIAVEVMVEHGGYGGPTAAPIARKRSEEHTSELQSPMRHTYAVFYLK